MKPKITYVWPTNVTCWHTRVSVTGIEHQCAKVEIKGTHRMSGGGVITLIDKVIKVLLRLYFG